MSQKKEMINEFVNRLLEEKGILKGQDPEVQKQLRADLEKRVEDRINAAILREIPERELGTFEKRMEVATDEEIQVYLKSVIPDMDQILAAELVHFQATYLNA